MKTVYLFMFMAVVTLMAACDATTEKEVTLAAEDSTARVLSSDMYLNCWINEQTLQKEIFHSAPFGSKLDSGWADSYGLRAYVKDLGNELPKFVKVDFWAYYPATGINSKLVVSVDSLDKNKLWVGLDLKDSVKATNVWQHFNAKLTLPKRISPEDNVTVYVTSPDKKVMYVDDLTIKFLYR
jgi:hypothetical protein